MRLFELKCSKYNTCNAPICPESLDDNHLWYPGEDVCTRNFDFAKRHRKLAKKAKSGYFTPSMILHDCIVKTGITGIDPDRPEYEQISSWFARHKLITDEYREKARIRFQNVS